MLTRRVKERLGDLLDVGEVFCVLAAIDTLEAELSVPESELRYVEIGMRADLKLNAYPDRVIPGKVIAIRPSAEEREGENVVVARVSVDNRDGELKPGMRGRGRIIAGRCSLGRFLFRHPARWIRSWFW